MDVIFGGWHIRSLKACNRLWVLTPGRKLGRDLFVSAAAIVRCPSLLTGIPNLFLPFTGGVIISPSVRLLAASNGCYRRSENPPPPLKSSDLLRARVLFLFDSLPPPSSPHSKLHNVASRPCRCDSFIFNQTQRRGKGQRSAVLERAGKGLCCHV